jgi:hypothetical protein
MRDRIKKYECSECGIVCNVEEEWIDDGYGGEELVARRCSCCGRVIELR